MWFRLVLFNIILLLDEIYAGIWLTTLNTWDLDCILQWIMNLDICLWNWDASLFYFKFKYYRSCITSEGLWFLHTLLNRVGVWLLYHFKTFFVVNLPFVLQKHKPPKAVITVEFIDYLLTIVAIAELKKEKLLNHKWKTICIVYSLLVKILFVHIFVFVLPRMASKVDSFHKSVVFYSQWRPKFWPRYFLRLMFLDHLGCDGFESWRKVTNQIEELIFTCWFIRACTVEAINTFWQILIAKLCLQIIRQFLSWLKCFDVW